MSAGRRFRFPPLPNRVRTFGAAKDGNVAMVFGLALLPLMTGVGAAVDYSRANAGRAAMQSALDSALLAGAKDGSDSWTTVALKVFKTNVAGKIPSVGEPSFKKDDDDGVTYSGSVSGSIPSSILGVIGIDAIDVTAAGKATAAGADDSCILTLDHGQSRSHASLTLNGAPRVNLTGCSIRSNTSVTCNGHDGDLTKAYASGVAGGCSRPTSNAPVVPDTFKDLATNITSACGVARPGVTWTPGTLPAGPGLVIVSKNGYVEYHVCGDLTLSGTGPLLGNAPATDAVIVIENGNLIIADKASISTTRTAIVLTGDNKWPAKVEFPNGAGKQAKLSLSPPTGQNPWNAVSLFLDPKLTKDVDNNWGPGAVLNADGLVYLGTSDVVTRGNAGSGNSQCTKFVTNSFVTNGAVDLDFSQKDCAVATLKQWGGSTIVHLIQ